MNLTKKQAEILEYIDNFIVSQGYSPTYREIMAGLGYKSVATVAKHIDNLVMLGCLEKSDGGEARSVSIKKQGREYMDDTEKFVLEFLEKRADEFSRRGDFSTSKKIQDTIESIWG
ncbi:MAG: hypothetical protein Q4A21_03410 [bacterium]|nr:hypothetical protein [bacterium]